MAKSLSHEQADRVRLQMREINGYLARLHYALADRGHDRHRHPFAREVWTAWQACIEISAMALCCGSGMYGRGALHGTLSRWFGSLDKSDGEIDGSGI